ncbi:unnamed protein product [Ectocarpus fasciculatus]
MEEEFLPPLPACITDILRATKLCYLATSEDHAPHLSLMNFSFMNDEEYGNVLVMSTRRNTKKFEALVKNPKVAILIHDFDCKRSEFESRVTTSSSSPATPAASPGTFSVTVYGEVLVASGERAEALRSNHLLINPDYRQFILGEEIAILVFQPNFARMCNINDTVSMWCK